MSMEEKLKNELKALKRKAEITDDLEVIWAPDADRKLSGEVKGKTIYIYESEEEKAVNTLIHEFIDFLVSRALEPYVSLVNAMIKLLNDIAYRRKEETIETIVRLLTSQEGENVPQCTYGKGGTKRLKTESSGLNEDLDIRRSGG
ncbi:hypothetical protein [Candidatus Methanodesulfokora washburnensis]|uniref:Uncharacterized protein n=1 Tax=Candidatus Methanodesulfokora washburnensis TaxID=2478471 RepID=A0A429GQ60_9CREN|nr:hypothetical protein [Candidatus Methanodesulfokores washburnensis]RSN75988.1 hypothetical protein D6D85_05070 [Candidatus Methanodesulfokores washburnensis]